VAGNSFGGTIPADSVQVTDHVIWPIPADAATGEYRVDMLVTDAAGAELSRNFMDFVVR